MKKQVKFLIICVIIIIMLLVAISAFIIKNMQSNKMLHLATFETFDEKAGFLVRKLNKIRTEILNQNGEETYKYMLAMIDRLISECSDENNKEVYERIKQDIIFDKNNEELFFYKYNANDITTKKRGEYFVMPKICVAQGQRWCQPTLGLIFSIIDTNDSKASDVSTLSISETNENIGTIRISTRYIDSGVGGEQKPNNKFIFNNAMKYVYRFFEGKITKTELDFAVREIIELGKNDRRAIDLLLNNNSLSLQQKVEEAEKIAYFPDVKVQKTFKDRNYTFKYDNFYGNVVIEFCFDKNF